MLNSHPIFKAAGSIALVLIFAIIQIWLWPGDWAVGAPLIVFFAVLMLNTFFSIKFFSQIIPSSIFQAFIDLVLLGCFLILTRFLFDRFYFMEFCTLLFIVAILKYAQIESDTKYRNIISRKLFVDTLGTVACALTLIGISFGYGALAVYLWTAAFAVANWYYLIYKSLYRMGD